MESPAELTPGEQQDYDQPFCCGTPDLTARGSHQGSDLLPFQREMPTAEPREGSEGDS